MANLLKPASEINILIVDDTPNNLRLLANMLEAQQYHVRKSLNGRMALQAAYRHPPDLILLDINMPEMNGYEVCKQLKTQAITSDIPIIFISALDEINDKVRAFEIGGQDYITKPFQELEVVMRVRNQLLIQQQRQELLETNRRLEQEIQERLKAEAEVRQLALTDELTGLYNRRGFFLLAQQQLKIVQRTQTSCCLLFADLDGLKQINDSLGHQVGDKLIVDFSGILRESFRDADILARIGGDEFVVLIPGGLDNADKLQIRLENNIDYFNANFHRPYQISISLGMCLYSAQDDISLEKLLADADQLMYENKRAKYSKRAKIES